jgi:hypothetical protein
VEKRSHRWWDLGPDDAVDIALGEEERELLAEGLHQWGGAARPTDALARLIGFNDVETMHSDGRRIRKLLREGGSLTKLDWQRALVALEIVWASNFYGAANDWEAVAAGWTDARTLQTLRSIQHQLAGLRAPPRRLTPR